ncbi:FAD/NAD(P)-binding domain-containing protein [Mytilinidion resinicola]|uniref:FAD/NAD(P)-binding domain-containing protein n=1 Tax=Mytilinidion resinicola TaxID=574789 RepID=A0A6A6YRF0_9PEZI|nr:FAD/NAD(P)-binding domain-containing protein [Mytilinidion resinicola]KAF2811512.1 FAD/NAD(P)-binding domain-containing protein [Mytilinidion resinicola]
MSSPRSRAPSSTKIAVIGGGPQGLCALKNLLEEGFDAMLLEQRDRIGGLWAYSDDPNTVTVLESTLTNVSKYKNCYSDFPIGKDEPVYFTQAQFLDYLERYADAFNFRPRIRLNTSVLRISKSTSNADGWDIKAETKHASSPHTLQFDKVVLATGAHHTPSAPTLPGASIFAGQILHSSAFKHPPSFAGKRVLVIGFSNTAADICAELVAHHAASVTVAHRRGIHVLPRLVNGKPVDLFASRRVAAISATVAAIAPVKSLGLVEKALADLSEKSWDLDPAWGFRPAPPRITNRVMLSDTFVPQLRDGSIKSVANVKQIVNGETVELEDGSRVATDVIIFCTGYHRRDPPFLAEILGGEKERLIPHRLYQNIFPPAYADSVAVLDSWQLGSGICEVADLACMAVAQVFKGAFPLPSEDRMNREVDAHHRWVNTVLSREPAAAAKVVQEGKWRGWLHAAAGTGVNENLGYGWKGWWFWVWQPRWCSLLMGGIDLPYLARLFEGRRKKWEGAGRAIVEANEDLEMRFGKGTDRKKVK